MTDPKERIVVCPECKEESKRSEWDNSEVLCDDCGTHPALVCPKCKEPIDQIFDDFDE